MSTQESFQLVVVSAGTSDPSSTRLLADRTAERVAALAERHGHQVTISVIELREIGRRHARTVARAMTARLDRGELAQLEAICRKLAVPMAADDKNKVLVP
jgi:FMN reductase